MKLVVHRGTHQIGGCVTELRTSTTRIVIDMGSSLPGPEGTAPEAAFSLSGVTTPGEPCDGVFFTHNHGTTSGKSTLFYRKYPCFWERLPGMWR